MFNCLLKIKDRREDRLRRQITELTRQYQQAEQHCFQCRSRREALAQTLEQHLFWSGTLPVGKLMEKKQVMNRLFNEEQDLAQQMSLLADTQNQLQARISQLKREQVSIMKKKEKLRSLLNDEC